MNISADKYAEMLWGGTLPYVSPRPGIYISFCATCFEWRPLMTKATWGHLESSSDSSLMTPTVGTFTAEGAIPGVDAANQPQLCRKCTEQGQREWGGLSDDELTEVQDGVDTLKSMLALIRVGFKLQEAGDILESQNNDE